MLGVGDGLGQAGENLGGVEQGVGIVLLHGEGVAVGLEGDVEDVYQGSGQLGGEFGVLGDFVLNACSGNCQLGMG